MNKVNKLIFLDFDGVLNTEHYQGLLMYQGKPWQDKYGALFDPATISNLKKIVDSTHADIVIESSWKYLGLTAMQEMWEVRQLPGRVVDITPSAVSDEWLLTADLSEIDPARGHRKGMEIASWLADNSKRDMRYVILDDEYVILDSQQPYFILTNQHEGITARDVERAIAILNG